jgi:transposase, IS5 family
LTFEHAIEALLDQAATLAYSGGSQCSRSWSFRDKQPSDERTEFLINDRLSFIRFLGLELAHRLPDARTIWLLRETPTQAGVLGPLFERFDATLRQGGLHRHVGSERGCEFGGGSTSALYGRRKTGDQGRPCFGRVEAKPAELRLKDRDARWTVQGQAERGWCHATGPIWPIPVFGYQNHISIDRGFGFIRKWGATRLRGTPSVPIGGRANTVDCGLTCWCRHSTAP